MWIHTLTEGCDWRNDLNFFKQKKVVVRCWKKTQRPLPELCSPAIPLGPTMSSPLGSSSFCISPTSSSNLDCFCVCSTLWEKKKERSGKSQLAMHDRAVAHCLEMAWNIPQVPDYHMVKQIHTSKFQPSRKPFWSLGKFQSFWTHKKGQIISKEVRQSNRHPVPQIGELSEYNSVFYHFARDHIFPKSGMAYLFWMQPCFSFI